jgi:hypothetical protein
VQKRIFGLETEYGIIFTPEGRKTLPVEKAIRFLFEKLITTEHFLNVFLENGARFYQDTGCHPEYATPECASPRQLIVFDKAGERILEDLQDYAEEKIREERIAGRLSIFKNNTDFVGNSYGCHENFLVDRDVDFYYLAEQLIPFLVTRQIYTGAGKVFQTQDGVHYCISQRAQHIYQKISGTTTNDRSIINTRDEPHADREKYRRLHVIVGDSNMSEYTNLLKVATCALVLQMIEDNYINKDFTLRNPVKAIKDISYDTTCKRKLRLDNGRALRRPRQARRQDRLDHQASHDRVLHLEPGSTLERPSRLHDGPAVPRHPPQSRSVLRAGASRSGGSRAHRRRDHEGQDRAAAGHPRQDARGVHQAGPPELDPVRPRLVEHPSRQPPERAGHLQQPVRDGHREGRGAGADHPEDEPAQDEPLEPKVERQPPHLVAVASDESETSPPEPAPQPDRQRGRAALILALLLVVAVSGLLAQSWRVSRLETQVAELGSRLGAAQAEIEAHEAHLGRVRDAVGDVRREVTALEALVGQQP